jgi:hypothetical protein
MTEHWAETNKHKAKEAFENAPREEVRPPDKQPYQRPPQPQLTPKGPMRREADQRVREKQEAIRAKFVQDKEKGKLRNF